MGEDQKRAFYRVGEIAERLGVSTQTLYLWIEEGAVSVARPGPGRIIRIPASEVEKLESAENAED